MKGGEQLPLEDADPPEREPLENLDEVIQAVRGLLLSLGWELATAAITSHGVVLTIGEVIP